MTAPMLGSGIDGDDDDVVRQPRTPAEILLQPTAHVGEPVVFKGVVYTLVEAIAGTGTDAGEVHLCEPDTPKNWIRVPFPYFMSLATAVEDPPAVKAMGDIPFEEMLRRMPTLKQQEIDYLAPHLYEVVYGELWVHGVLQPADPRYDIDKVSERMRIRNKHAEIQAFMVQNFGYSEFALRTLANKVRDYAEQHRSGLLDGRWLPNSSHDRAFPEFFAICVAVVADLQKPGQSKLRRGRLRSEALSRAKRQHVPVPARPTQYRHLVEARATNRTAKQISEEANSPPAREVERVQNFAGDMEVDDTIVNIMCSDHWGKWRRYYVMIMRDRRTHVYHGRQLVCVHRSGPSTYDVIALISQGPYPLWMRPGYARYMAHCRAAVRSLQLALPDEDFYDAAKVPPTSIYRVTTDNAAHYRTPRSHEFYRSFGMSHRPALIRHPEHKAIAEGGIDNLDVVWQLFPESYCGDTFVNRGDYIEARCGYSALVAFIDLRMAILNTTARAYTHPDGHPGLHESPLLTLRKQQFAVGDIPLRPRIDHRNLLPSEDRMITKQGIQFDRLTYIPNRLGEQLARRGENGRRVSIRYDPADRSAVYFYDDHLTSWVDCPWKLAAQMYRPFGQHELEFSFRNAGAGASERDMLLTLQGLDGFVTDAPAHPVAQRAIDARKTDEDRRYRPDMLPAEGHGDDDADPTEGFAATPTDDAAGTQNRSDEVMADDADTDAAPESPPKRVKSAPPPVPILSFQQQQRRIR